MTQCSADFDLGSPPASISTSDPGSLTPWDTVNIATGATVAYDNARSVVGNSAKFASGSTSTSPYCAWTTRLGTLTGTQYCRYYINVSAVGTYMGQTLQLGGGVVGQCLYTPSQGLQLWTGAALVKTSVTTLPLNSWMRIEWYAVLSLSVGQLGYRIYLSPGSTTPDETYDSAANLALSNPDNVVVGVPTGNSAANIPSFWMDGVVVGAPSWVGPIASAGLPLLPPMSRAKMPKLQLRAR